MYSTTCDYAYYMIGTLARFRKYLQFIKVSPTIASSLRSSLSHICKIQARVLRFLSIRQNFPLLLTHTTNPMMMIHARINIMTPKDCTISTYNSNKPKIFNYPTIGQRKLHKHDIDQRVMIYSIKHHVYIDGTEVCGRMNHCIQRGIGDGDGGEDDGEGNAGRHRRPAVA